MPPGFDYPGGTEAWYPGYVPKALIRDQNSRDLRVIAKLKPGMTSELFRQELLRLQSEVAKEFPATDLTWAPIVAPLRDELLGDVRPALISLYVLIALLALLGFVNVLTLMLVRADARRTQYATQLALGSPAAGPRMQLIAEGLIVALMGWGIAVVVARATVGLVVSWLPASLPQLGAIALDIRLLCISLGIAIVAGVVWGVLTALHIEHLGVIEALAFNQRDSSEQAPRRRWRDAAVVCEVAIAVVILAAALVSVAEMRRLHQSDPGFSGREVVAARIHVSIARLEEIYRTLAAKSPMGQRLPNNGISNVVFAQDLLAQVADIPGVQLASVSGTLPLADPLLTVFVSRADSPASATGDSRSDSLSAYLVEATEDFFRVLRTPLHSGRFFSELDRMGAEPVAIVNQTLARRLWGGGPAVGRLLAQARHEKPLRVVGVVADMARLRPGELPVPTIYRPFAQSPPASIRLLILADTTAQRIRPALSEAARRLGGNLIDAQDLSSIIAQSIAPARSTALALGMLATIAMLLAFAGLYANFSAMLQFRQRELGIRIAVGASPANVALLVIKQALVLTVAGTALGLVATFAIVKGLSTWVPLPAVDTTALAATVVVVLASALLASVRPLIRATRLNPSLLVR
jgi:predicted permease